MQAMGASAGFISWIVGVLALVPRSGMRRRSRVRIAGYCLAYATGVVNGGKDTTAIASIVYTELATGGSAFRCSDWRAL